MLFSQEIPFYSTVLRHILLWIIVALYTLNEYTAKERLKFKGNEELLWSLQQLEETSTRTGLQPEHIVSLVDVAASGQQVETVSKKIIKCLIPATVVPEMAILKVISWLCTRKPSLSLQCLLVRWILVVYEYIDKLDNIYKLYGVLFNFLHYRALMPYLCHLLYLLTRKEDVKVFRVRQLMQYQRDMGSQPYLTGLLSIYRHFDPSLVYVVVPRTYKSFFPVSHADRQWNAAIQKAREGYYVRAEPDMSWEKALKERLYPPGKQNDLVPSRKRRKMDPIPALHSLTTKSNHKKDRLENLLGLSRIPFVQIGSFKDVLKHIDSIEFPSQIGAVLRSEILRHVLSFTKDPIAGARFQFWISETLQEELNSQKSGHSKKDLLQTLLRFSDFIQEGVQDVDIVLTTYLEHWNGLVHAPLILKLLARCKMYPFELLCGSVLEPLRKLFLMSSVIFKCKVIVCLTELLHNYAANEWPRSLDVSDDTSCSCLFSRNPSDLDAVDVLVKLMTYISRLLLVASIEHKHNAILESCILDFLDLVCNLHKTHHLPFVVLAEPRLLERLLISPNPVTVTRVCSVICGYKVNFGSLKVQQRTGEIQVFHPEGSQMVSRCNQLILDFCNSLWRGKAFSNADKGSVFYMDPVAVDKTLDDQSMPESLSIYRHPAFLGFAAKFIEKEKLGPGCDISQIKDIKTEYLHFLEECHLDNIMKFISLFIRRRTSGNTQLMGLTQNVTNLTTDTSHQVFD